MLYKINAKEHPFWVYYVNLVIEQGEEIFVFKRSKNESFAKYLNDNEYYFLHVCDPDGVYDCEFKDGKVQINRTPQEKHWKIYLWGKDLVTVSSRSKIFEAIDEFI
jgi:hypothetical protein